MAIATALLVSSAAHAGVEESTVESLDPGTETGLGIALIGGPPDAADGIGPGRAIYDAVQPGTSRTWQLRVSNHTSRVLPVELRVVDATLGDNGLMFSDEESNGPVAEWISFRPASVELTPGESVEVFVDITPPPGVPTTEVLAAVVAQPPATEQGAIGVVQRVAVPIYMTTGPVLALPDFEILTLTAGRLEDGTPVVDVAALNTGERVLSVVGLLELGDGPGGLSVEPVLSSDARSLGVGETGIVRFLLDPALPSGPWHARATLSGGNVERAAAATITFPAESGTKSDPLAAEETDVPDDLLRGDGFNVNPNRRILLPLAAILILLAIGSLLAMVMWKRREEEEDDEDEPVAAAATSAAGEDDGG